MPATISSSAITNLGVRVLARSSVTDMDLDTAAPGTRDAWGSGDHSRRASLAHRGVSVVAMPPGSHERPGRSPRGRLGREASWRAVTLVVVVLTGFLFAVSAEES